ncbi:MAG: T9SS type A sorting domain-containing protein [Bacteroidia bacterium]|nr:T9SS type A sorting domain-containing protein [Bacteroidia bacterium]
MKTNHKPNAKLKWFMIGALSTILSLGFNFNSFAQYCSSSGNSTNYSYIDEVIFENIMNTSGDNGGYADFTNLSTSVIPGNTYTIKLDAANQFPFTFKKNKWKVWIDFNNDGDFDDAGEMVVKKRGNGTTNSSITIPSNFSGTTTMRVSMSLFGQPKPCGNISNGEVEDYTITSNSCLAGAGSLMADASPVGLMGGSVMISATQINVPVIPAGYSSIYVLTSGTGLVIEQVNATPDFTVNTTGLYTIHTLIYDPATLDLTTVVFGTTTGVDVNGLLVQGGGTICAALDVAGAPITVCMVDAGMVTSNLGDTLSICAGDGFADPFTMSNNGMSTCNYAYVITSSATEILGLSLDGNLDFDGAGQGECWVWGLSFTGNVLVSVGDTVLGFGALTDGAFDLSSNYVVVQRNAPDAGTLTANSSSVCSMNGNAMIDATANGDDFIPPGYSNIYVLTSGTGLVIEQVNATPSFNVTSNGLYTIHNLVYDATTLDLTTVVFGTTTGVDVNGLLTQGGGSICASLDVAGAPIWVSSPDAGTITANTDTVCGIGSIATLTATPDGNAMIPSGYSTVYVLTSGSGLVIEQAGPNPSFDVSMGGNYTIHTLVYDPNTLDLSIVVPGVTTGFDVNSLLVQGGGMICASLDVPGAAFYVENPYAGTIQPDYFFNCLDNNGSATLTANPSGDAIVPSGYSTVYVLTSGSGLVIEQAGGSPSFTVNNTGIYRIHTLVYDTNTLDLGIVVPGTTTGFDVNGLIAQGGGAICASLDVAGAPFIVLPEWICNWFYNDRVNMAYYTSISPEQAYAEITEGYENSKSSTISNGSATMYPNPAINHVTIAFDSEDDNIETVLIYNETGQKVFERDYTANTMSTINLDVSGFDSGLYLIQLITVKSSEALRLVVK